MTRNTRDFDTWLGQFKPVIASYDYYVDFDKAIANTEKWRSELHLMNSLLGSKSIESDFLALVKKYPDVLNVVPTLIAVRATEVPIYEVGMLTKFQFGGKKKSNRPQDYADFMRSTGLFELMESHYITNLLDYVMGVEVGLDSNGRKNRGGHLMENLVEGYLRTAGLACRNSEGRKIIDGNPQEVGVYYKELYTSTMQSFWGIDLSEITNSGTVEKRFDFVVRTAKGLFGIETNFYSGGGSKLNETSRSYKEMAQESERIPGFQFVWVTDGGGWKSARNNLRETFEIMDTIYNLNELEEGTFKRLFVQ
ncbi:type II restriction endonuclease [Atopobium sp. oral taxon 810]|uniref:type II restriction endonuclease n=1 Tax=Atopobium sp. oral taxon 810 TaxID=712158 RepID=UPI00039746F5|nr:type II restriction endonuclease [Atopobium sp. oral taxon 810]ERI05127.1 DpmII restriction endonuclease [Atopobium sp. oral taxon 810 str. F0209]